MGNVHLRIGGKDEHQSMFVMYMKCEFVVFSFTYSVIMKLGEESLTVVKKHTYMSVTE